MSTSHDDDPRVLELLASALEIQARGEAVDLERHCAEHPELQTQVAAALGLAEHLPVLQRAHRAQGADTFAGRVLAGRYRLEERLGAGAMGVVYRGLDLELRRPVAVKLLRSDLWGGEEALARFAREAEALAAIRHPAVVTVHDRGRSAEDELEFLVMELLEGASLGEIVNAARAQDEAAGGSARSSDLAWVRELLGAESLPEQTWVRLVVRWCAELAAGLRAAHEAGVLHRDLKPSNVFIRRDGRPVLLDFGIAALSGGETVAQRSSALGTPAYMAPEQLAAEQRVTTAADVYGLTATLYAALTNRPPYAGSLSQVLSAMQRREPTPAYKLRPGLPRDLQAILDCGMARPPEKRYAEAAGLEADLRAFLDYRPVAARPVTMVRRFWRRAWAAREVKAGAAVALVLICSMGAIAWSERRTRLNRSAWNEVLSLLPPSLSMQRNPAARIFHDRGERARIETQLDQLCELADDPIPSRLWRSAFRFDHGDRLGAAQDVAEIAAASNSAYLDALSGRYLRCSSPELGAEPLDLEQLPPAVSTQERFVAAFHCMRSRRTAEDVDQVLSYLDDSTDIDPHAHELRTIALLEQATTGPLELRRTRFQTVLERAIHLEAVRGFHSANVSFLQATALAQQGRYLEAESILRNGVGRNPDAAMLHVNLAFVQRQRHKPEAAIESANRALTLRPDLMAPRATLVLAHIDLLQFDQAQAVVDAMAHSEDRSRQAHRLHLGGLISLARAKLALREGDDEARKQHAARASLEFLEATELGVSASAPEAALSQVLELEDPRAGIAIFMEQLVQADARDWFLLDDLLSLWPERLDDEQSRLIQAYLRALIDASITEEERASR